MNGLLDIESLTVRFDGLVAVREVDMTVERGDIHGLVGPNGAGKTSLVNAATGYVQAEGSIRVNGQEQLGRSTSAIAEAGISRTFQHIQLFPHLSVLENVLVGRHRFEPPSWARACTWFGRHVHNHEVETEEAQRVIRLMRLESVRDTSVERLPYGVQKLVGIGRALASEPQLLFLDEPFGGLTGEERELVARALLEIRTKDLTIVMIEHDMRVISELCDVTTVLDQGRVIVSDKPHEALRNEAVVKAYLGSDYER